MAFGLLKNESPLTTNEAVAANDNPKKQSPEERMRNAAMRVVAARQQAEIETPNSFAVPAENTVLPSSFSELAKAIRDGAETSNQRGGCRVCTFFARSRRYFGSYT
jgi:hypothetical protein